MKRFKNLVIGGIQNKIFNLILLTVLLIAVVSIPISNWHTGMLSRLTEETGIKQQASMSEITGSVIDQVIRTNMDRITERDSQLADQIFQNLKTQVTIMGEYAENLYAVGTGAENGAILSGPKAAEQGTLCAKLLMAEGADPEEEETAKTISLLSQMSDVMVKICRAYEASNCYIGTNINDVIEMIESEERETGYKIDHIVVENTKGREFIIDVNKLQKSRVN